MSELRTDVAALFVDRLGPYPKLVSDCYDAERDARTYVGSIPVVVHPPCGPWGRLRHLSKHDDPAHAPWAVDVVRRCGGVLEHPAGSKLWEHCSLPLPGAPADAWGGATIEVCQVDWGHVARKRTWLYLVRCEPGPMPPPGTPTHWISGFRSSSRPRTYDRSGSAVPPGIKICSAQQRRRTPVAFARWLCDVAAGAS